MTTAMERASYIETKTNGGSGRLHPDALGVLAVWNLRKFSAIPADVEKFAARACVPTDIELPRPLTPTAAFGAAVRGATRRGHVKQARAELAPSPGLNIGLANLLKKDSRADGTVTWETCVQVVHVEATQSLVIANNDHPSFYGPELTEVWRNLQDAYSDVGRITTNEVRGWILDHIKRAYGVSLKNVGGVYFVPKGMEDRMFSLKEALSDCAAWSGRRDMAHLSLIQLVPHRGTDEEGVVRQGVEEGLGSALETLVREVEGLKTDGAIKDRLESIAEVEVQIEYFEELFGEVFEDLREQIKAAEQQVQQALEVTT